MSTSKGRHLALQETGKRYPKQSIISRSEVPAEAFGKYVFSHHVMQKMLPPEVYQHLLEASEGKTQIKLEHANTIALAIRDWAMNLGATHFTHWFQPQTGSTAEKHDCFVAWNVDGEIIEEFSGKQLVQGEPDASSFPSGGLRSTYEARGYTGWDPTSPVFLWKGGDGLTLCIPSIFFSWTGDVLDNKIPLLRSDEAINRAVLRLLKHTKIPATHVYSTLGLEQEYFVIDRALRDQRPDLLLAGRTLLGAPSPKGQEMQDHYFGTVKDRILSFMQDFEQSALHLGIPVKTRHNEVAPAQHEVAQVFEKASAAIDHNILLMELMRQTALKHDFACLLHEKPFHDLNGSGKHSNWSLMTEKGVNLLEPSDDPHFLFILTAILAAVHRHAELLRASIGSLGNDERLGGHEAPPAVISVYLGEALETLLNDIEKSKKTSATSTLDSFSLGISSLPNLMRDNTDRNRTSPFAFTGNKFEFRALGSASSPSFPATILNTIVAEQINMMVDQLEKKLEAGEKFASAAIDVMQHSLKQSKPIRFSGDNYSHDWLKEASKRGLPNIPKSTEAFKAYLKEETKEAFKGILTSEELRGRYEISIESYLNALDIELSLLLELAQTQVLPTAIEYQKQLAKSIKNVSKVHRTKLKQQKKWLDALSQLIESLLIEVEKLNEERKKAQSLTNGKKASIYIKKLQPIAFKLREAADSIEMMVDDKEWPLPKYRELLFMV